MEPESLLGAIVGALIALFVASLFRPRPKPRVEEQEIVRRVEHEVAKARVEQRAELERAGMDEIDAAPADERVVHLADRLNQPRAGRDE